MSPNEIIQLIEDFCNQTWSDGFDPRYSFAHVVLDDYNVSENAILFCVKLGYEAYDKNPQHGIQIGKVLIFLSHLLGIPLEDRAKVRHYLLADDTIIS